MTVASEITRLQGAKSDIRQAIIDKGVDVGASLTIDEYAACILDIPSGPKSGYIDILVVGGGGDGGHSVCWNAGGGGGGAGGVIALCGYGIGTELNYNVIVGAANQNSCFDNLIAYCGGHGGYRDADPNQVGNGGSGGGQPGGSSYGRYGRGCSGQGNNGGWAGGGNSGGGGGGGGCVGGNGQGGGIGGAGGDGILNDFSGTAMYYGGGGGGGGGNCGNNASGPGGCGGCGGGGDGGTGKPGCPATYYGGGGGGGGCARYCGNGGGAGCQGIVIIRYKTDGSCGILPSSNGGCKYTCGDYTIHCFTTTGTTIFTPVYK